MKSIKIKLSNDLREKLIWSLADKAYSLLSYKLIRTIINDKFRNKVDLFINHKYYEVDQP